MVVVASSVYCLSSRCLYVPMSLSEEQLEIESCEKKKKCIKFQADLENVFVALEFRGISFYVFGVSIESSILNGL